ncbi:MAG: S1C family serine protease [Planctomycetota bacterium]|jgi:serine protease Do
MRSTRICCTLAAWLSISLSSCCIAQSLSTATSELKDRQTQYEDLAKEVQQWEEQNRLLRKAVRLVSPTVVHIEATKEEPVQEVSLDTRLDKSKGRTKRVEEAGAGVVIEHQGRDYVLTNRHVIQSAKAEDIRIETYDSIPLQILKITEDASTDLAVIDVGRSDLPACRLGDSRRLEVGEHVFAVGSPFGLNHSVSLGIVSAKGRRNLELGNKSIVYQDFIQTDAAINPGNSGGPLMNLRGEVVGINTAIASNSGVNEGIGFAIPMHLAFAVATQLIEKGELQRSYLGVSVERAYNVDSQGGLQNQRARGALVKVVKPNSPAEIAGLKYGDIILTFDGVSVENDEHLIQLVGLANSSQPVELEVLRERARVCLSVSLTPITLAR